jgi:glycerol-3-phosphate dehydrogenase
VTPTVHGNLMIGPDSVEVEDPGQRPATTGEGLGRVDALARKSVPKLRLDRTIRVFSGLRATPDTGDFMIYESKHNPGFLHAGGIESPGLAASPAIGRMVCELAAATGRLPQVKRDQIIERRSGIKAFRQMTPKQREAAIAADPNYGSIICRCETVSEAEILQAIHRPAGAVTMDGVKRRVRPGMGRCQGTFCGPKVIAILARELGISEEEVLKDSRGSRVILGHTKGKE